MNPKVLTLLNPRTARMDGAGGGLPTLTANDINAACYGADPAGVEILLRKWAGLRTSQSAAFYGLYREVAALAARFKWKIRGKPKEKLRSLLQLAIFEATETLPCFVCKGRSEVMHPIDLKIVRCPECKGIGKYRIEAVDMAKVLGISRQAWHKGRWQHRYDDIRILVDTAEHQAIRKIGKQLKSDMSI